MPGVYTTGQVSGTRIGSASECKARDKPDSTIHLACTTPGERGHSTTPVEIHPSGAVHRRLSEFVLTRKRLRAPS